MFEYSRINIPDFNYLCSFGCIDLPPIITTTNLKEFPGTFTTKSDHTWLTCPLFWLISHFVFFPIDVLTCCVSISNLWAPRNSVWCENLVMGDTPSYDLELWLTLKLHGLVPPHVSTIVSLTDLYASKKDNILVQTRIVCHIVQPYNISSTICVILAICFCGQNYGWGYQSNHIIIPARSSMISPLSYVWQWNPPKKTLLIDGWILWKPQCCWWNHNEWPFFR